MRPRISIRGSVRTSVGPSLFFESALTRFSTIETARSCAWQRVVIGSNEGGREGGDKGGACEKIMRGTHLMAVYPALLVPHLVFHRLYCLLNVPFTPAVRMCFRQPTGQKNLSPMIHHTPKFIVVFSVTSELICLIKKDQLFEKAIHIMIELCFFCSSLLI